MKTFNALFEENVNKDTLVITNVEDNMLVKKNSDQSVTFKIGKYSSELTKSDIKKLMNFLR